MSRLEVTIDKPNNKTPSVPRGFMLAPTFEPAPVYCPEVSKEYMEEIMKNQKVSRGSMSPEGDDESEEDYESEEDDEMIICFNISNPNRNHVRVPRGFMLPGKCEPERVYSAPVYCPEVSKEYIEEIIRNQRISRRNNDSK